jgi:aminoglycoside phosphotransferase (APT) family kinase protein
VAETLPRPVRLRLDQTLAQWRHWHCEPALAAPPRVERLLGEGHSNHNVLVGGAARFVVRIDGVDPSIHGLNRRGEWRNLQAAHAAGLAPRPCYFNPDLGSLVCDYLEPVPPSAQSPAEIAGLLRGIHRLPACHARLALRERVLRYEHRLAARRKPLPERLVPLREPVWRSLQRAVRRTRPQVLCHNDLLRANRIRGAAGLLAIDWEYSAMGDPLYDLAVVIAGDELDSRQGETLAGHYLGRAPSADERAALADYLVVYRYLALLWYLAEDHPVMDGMRQERDIARLEAALERTGDGP